MEQVSLALPNQGLSVSSEHSDRCQFGRWSWLEAVHKRSGHSANRDIDAISPDRHARASQDVSLSAILVAAKVEDTLKKLRDIQIAGYQVTNIMEGGQGTSEGDGSVSGRSTAISARREPSEIDAVANWCQQAQEAHRPNLIAIERLVLQTICFNFHLHRSLPPTSSSSVPPELLALTEASTTQSRDIFTYTVRFCRALAAPKPFAFLAHLIAIDLHRTLAPLTYPPHTCAVASIYLASFMFHGHSNTTGWMGTSAQELSGSGSGPRGPELKDGWMDELESNPDDVRGKTMVASKSSSAEH